MSEKKSEGFVAPLTKIYRERKKKKENQNIASQASTEQITPKVGGSIIIPGGLDEVKIARSASFKQSFIQNLAIPDPTSVLKQGFIKKYVNIMRGFKKRYFVLSNELLIYYKDKKGQVSEKGQISLKLARVDPRTMNDKKMTIGTGMSEVHLEFATIAEKKEWMIAIDECKKRLTFSASLLISESPDEVRTDDQEEEKDISKGSDWDEGQPKPKKSSRQANSSVKQKTPRQKDSEDKEVKDALNAALQANILKEDSALSVHLADTWMAQSYLEESLNDFKVLLQTYQDTLPKDLIKIGEKIENSSNDLKKSVTNAIQVVEKTKLQIIKILEIQEDFMQKKANITANNAFENQGKITDLIVLESNHNTNAIDEKGYLGEESKAFVSFSQEFNDIIEKKRSMAEDPFVEVESASKTPIKSSDQIEQLRASRSSRLKKIDEIDDEDDDFFDARGDEQTLQHCQQEIFKSEEVAPIDLTTARENLQEDIRTVLPALKPPDQKVSVWKVIKDAIGKDLSKFCVPVYFNEPISMLQKVSEIMEYENLLVKGDADSDSLKRLLYVTAFGICQYKCSDRRTNKPFNPILGETFELMKPEYLFFSEQVCHHPPISACYAQSDSYEFWMNTSMKTNFWGKSLEVKPIGYQNVRLKSTGEHFVIERPTSSVNNLIFGEMYVEHHGMMTVRNLKNGEYTEVDFKKRGWGGKGAYEVEGFAFNTQKEKKWSISGKWIEQLSIKNLDTNEEIQVWEANPLPLNYQSMYYFTLFTLQLNYLPQGLKDKLPPTDSRFRPDQRALEEGDLNTAANEKSRLEDKQRNMRKDRELLGLPYQAKYFEEYLDPDSKEKSYKYVRNYWEDRKKGDWAHLDDLF